jgi:hypothetical protein
MFAQQIAVERIIRVFEESLCATIATLRHVVRMTGKHSSSQARHLANLAAQPRSSN